MKTKLKIFEGMDFSELSVGHPKERSKLDWISISKINKMARLSLENADGEEFNFLPKYKHQASSITSHNVLLEQGFGIGLMPEDIAN